MMRDNRMRKSYNGAQAKLHLDAKESVNCRKEKFWDPLNG